jgi:hypothetical protein
MLYGIAEPSQVNDGFDARTTAGVRTKVQPCIINLDGEGTPVTFDDSYFLTLYHRVFSEAITGQAGRAFGNKAQDFVVSRADCELVVTAQRVKVKMNPRILAGQIFAMFPSNQITITDTSNNKLGVASVLVSSINFDSLAIFGRDYRGAEYYVSESLILIGIRYTIESHFRKECFNNCIC